MKDYWVINENARILALRVGSWTFERTRDESKFTGEIEGNSVTIGRRKYKDYADGGGRKNCFFFDSGNNRLRYHPRLYAAGPLDVIYDEIVQNDCSRWIESEYRNLINTRRKKNK